MFCSHVKSGTIYSLYFILLSYTYNYHHCDNSFLIIKWLSEIQDSNWSITSSSIFIFHNPYHDCNHYLYYCNIIAMFILFARQIVL